MRLVLDTNVVVSGLFWGGPPRRLLDLAREGRVVLFSSGVLLDELAGVLERDKFAAFLCVTGDHGDILDATLRHAHEGGEAGEGRSHRAGG